MVQRPEAGEGQGPGATSGTVTADPAVLDGPDATPDDGGRTGAGAGHGTRARRRRAVGAAALSIAVYVVLAVIVYWHVWSTHPTTVSQFGGDQLDNMWFYRWVPFALAHGHNPFFTDFANYPYGLNLLTETSSLFLGALFAPVTVLWGPVAAFNTVSTVALAGSATAGYFFVGRFVPWRPAAFAGGLLYGFGPYMIAQSAGHTNLTFVVFPPLILLVVHEIVVRQRGRAARWGVVLGLLMTAQFFVSTEVLASTIVMATVCVVIVGVLGHRHVRDHLRYLLVGAGWAALVSVVLLAYPAWFAVKGPGHISGPIQLVPQGYRADLLGPLYPDANQHFAPTHFARIAANFANSPTENGSYLGITLLVVLAVGVVVLWRRSPVIRVAALAGTAAFIISLGAGLVVEANPPGNDSGLPLPERLFTWLPELKNTIPVRYSLYVALFAALALGVILGALHRGLAAGGAARAGHAPAPGGASGRRWLATAVPALVVVVVFIPLLPAVPFTAVGELGVPAYFTSTAVRQVPDNSVALVYPYPLGESPGAQLWQASADLRFKMPGGYFLVPEGAAHQIAYSPLVGYAYDSVTADVLHDLFHGAPPPLTPALRAELRAQWASWHVRTVLAFPGGTADPGQAVRYLSALLGRLPVRVSGGGYAWYD